MPLFRRRSDDDFAREIQAHLDLEAERLAADGLPADEARAAARRRFGNVTRTRERFRESGRSLSWDRLAQDVRGAWRSMARSPVAVIVAVLSLAGGIGSTTATLTVRNAVFYNPPPLYRDAGELTRIRVVTPDSVRGDAVPGTLLRSWMAGADLRQAIAASGRTRSGDLRTAAGIDTIRVQTVSPELFDRLGVRPALGRTFAEASRDASPIAISHRLWEQAFDSRPDVVGAAVWFDDRPHTVIAVMPDHFWFATNRAQAWLPLWPEAMAAGDRFDVVVRRPPGQTLAGLAERLQRDVPAYTSVSGTRDLRVQATDIGGTPLADDLAFFIPWLVGGAVLLTLLIACANVAILTFARWTAREHEIAIRSSLGAGRWRVVRLLLAESILIAIAGGMLGVAATWVIRGLIAGQARAAGDLDLRIDAGLLFDSALVSLAAGLLVGIAPALYETRRLQVNPLRGLATSDRVRQRYRHALVVLEITVTVALLVVAATQVDAARRMLRTNLGFDTAPLLAVTVSRAAGVPTDQILDVIGAVPGVAGVAASTAVPMAGDPRHAQVSPRSGGSDAVTAEQAPIGAAYFETLGVPLRSGRSFNAAELASGARVAIVDEPLAARLWPGGSGAGDIWVDGLPYSIIGVSNAYSRAPFGRRLPRVYVPLAPNARVPATSMSFLVRAEQTPGPLVETIRRGVQRLGADYRVVSVFTLDQILVAGAQEILVLTLAMSPLLAMGLVLTATGIFGVLAFSIARRSREVALRIAIGATRADIARLVAGRSLRLVVIGVTAGTSATFALTRIVRASGGAGSVLDTPGWHAFAIPAAIVAAVCALATWVPARRALRIDPATLLRLE